MPFDNFYKESDKAARHWRKFLGLIFLLFVIYFIAFQIYLYLSKNNVPTGEITASAARRQHVDELCRNLPKPEKFHFTGRDEPIDYKDATAVIYHYETERNLEEIMPAFLIWFGANDWKPASRTSFTKGNQTVSIRTNGDYYYDGNYEIYCYEKSM